MAKIIKALDIREGVHTGMYKYEIVGGFRLLSRLLFGSGAYGFAFFFFGFFCFFIACSKNKFLVLQCDPGAVLDIREGEMRQGPMGVASYK